MKTNTAHVLALVKEITPDIVIFNLDTPSKKLLADLQRLVSNPRYLW